MVAASVEKHVFNVLRANNFCFEIFAHTFNLTEFHNPRNSEFHLRIDPTGLQTALSIPSSSMLYDSPEEADRLTDMAFLAKNGDPWPDTHNLSMRYFARQLHSLKRVTHLWLPTRHRCGALP